MALTHHPDDEGFSARKAFAEKLLRMFTRQDLTASTVAYLANLTMSQMSDYVSGRQPPEPEVFRRIVYVCGASAFERAELRALWREVLGPDASDLPSPDDAEEEPPLLLRVYIPSGRIYATQTHRFLSLFRDWVAATRTGIRMQEHRTPGGDLYEFFGDGPPGEPAVRERLDECARFLDLCATDPQAAVDALAETVLGPAASGEMIAWLGTEACVLREELHGEWEERFVRIRTELWARLRRQGHDVPRDELDKFLRPIVPPPEASAALALPALPALPPGAAPNVNNIQIINNPSGPVSRTSSAMSNSDRAPRRC